MTTSLHRTRRPVLPSLLKHGLLLLGALVMLYPLLWMLSSSFKPEQVIFKDLGRSPSRSPTAASAR